MLNEQVNVCGEGLGIMACNGRVNWIECWNRPIGRARIGVAALACRAVADLTIFFKNLLTSIWVPCQVDRLAGPSISAGVKSF